jgi:lysophospholipase L1-like esterase
MPFCATRQVDGKTNHSMRIIVLPLIALFAGCGGAGSTNIQAPPPTQLQTCARQNCDPAWVSELHVDQWFWSAGTIYRETVMPLATADGTAPHFPLWRPVATSSSVEVTQWVDGKVLADGTDYYLSNGQLVIPVGSSVKLAPHDYPFVADKNSAYANREFTKEGGPLLIGDYEPYQLQVTYETDSPPASPLVAGSLPNFHQKLAACAPIAITYYGDSLMGVGTHPIPDLVGAYLSKLCPNQISYRNQSLPGYRSGDGATLADQRLNDETSDVIVIAFGVNDAATVPGGSVSAADYQNNISAIISTVRAKAPGTEFVLVAAPEANSDWAFMDAERFPGYRDALVQLEEQLQGVAVVDVTTTWHDVIASKTFYDTTENGVNHPNDFGVFLYTQTLLKLLAGIP